MTALKEYQRLEALGLWRPAPDAQRVNVAVSIGDATLTLTDLNNRALSHWSLPAVRRLNPGERPALYAPSSAPDEPERLEIEEAEMIDAIETVRRAIARKRPHTGRLRLFVSSAVLAGALILALFWLPGALTKHTASVLPDAIRASVGERLLERLQRVTGKPCDAPDSQAALDRLATRVLGDDPGGRVQVIASGIAGARHVPGRIVLLDRAEVEDYDSADVAAGYILAEAERAAQNDPMAALLEHAGTWATARLLATGTLPDTVLDSYGEALFARPPAPVAPEPLLARFTAAKVPSSPYAFAIDQTGETTLALIEADPLPGGPPTPLVSDSDWTKISTICAE